MWSASRSGLFTLGRRPDTTAQEARLGCRLLWTGPGKFVCEGVINLDFQQVAFRNNGYVTLAFTYYEALQYVIFPTALLSHTQNQIFSSVLRSEIY